MYFKTLAKYFHRDLQDGLEGLTMKLFTHFLGWSREEVQNFLIDVRKDLQNPDILAYVKM